MAKKNSATLKITILVSSILMSVFSKRSKLSRFSFTGTLFGFRDSAIFKVAFRNSFFFGYDEGGETWLSTYLLPEYTL